MDDKTIYQLQRWAAWSGPVMVVTYFYFWGFLGHNLPPPSSAFSGQELVDNYYAKYRSDILLGMSLCTFTGFIYMIWSVMLTCQMWKREKMHLLSLLQLTGGVLTAWLLGVSPAFLVWCAKYAGTPGVDAELVKAIHLVSWYFFDMCYGVTSIQLLGCGLFAILDKKKPVMFPGWMGWFALAASASFLPVTVIPYFDEGPLALNGAWNFYTIFILWGLWFSGYSYYMFQDLKRMKTSPTPGIGQAVSIGGVD